MLRVGHRHHRLEPAQIAVGAPVLGQLDAGALELVGIPLQLGFQPLEQGEGVGGGAGEAGQDRAAGADAAHLAGVALDDGLAQRHLAVAGHGDLAVAADAQDRRAVPADGIVWFGVLHDGRQGGTLGTAAQDIGSPAE